MLECFFFFFKKIWVSRQMVIFHERQASDFRSIKSCIMSIHFCDASRVCVCIYLEYIYSNNDNVKEESVEESSFLSFFFMRLTVGSRRDRISKHLLPAEVFQSIYTDALAVHARTRAGTRTHTHIHDQLLCQIYDNIRFLLCRIHIRIWFLSKSLTKYFRLSV